MVTREDVQKTERMVDKFVKEMDELKYNIERDIERIKERREKYLKSIKENNKEKEFDMTKEELEEIKEIGRAVDALKKDTARIEREVNEIFKRIDPILEKE